MLAGGIFIAPQTHQTVSFSRRKIILFYFRLGQLSLLPAVRKAAPGDLVVADGASCRHQIQEGASREALHVVRILDLALEA
ncbi:hypothetical protein IHQ68_11390 [Chelatococcus sambhunathii]|uniref:Uncharacterized protein n=1 Tax=Chelatococcus sambhunathii TaxID=363953 RepID=A0ABU1DGK9_9HYPH|nr:hypothetical protein [Chelatococcus sambhunathii]MDR4307222.1 hypothetical protein [Chelatococcus sambhunathii]